MGPRACCCLAAAAACALATFAWLGRPAGDYERYDEYGPEPAALSSVGRVHLACVVCADRLPQATVMLKSAAMAAQWPLFVHVFADQQSANAAGKALESLFGNGDRFAFKVYNASFPQQHREQWESLFKPCAAQRLFLPDLLPAVDSVLYVDTDTLFFAPPERVWRHLGRFNGTHMVAFAPFAETEENWYRRKGTHPYYEPYGINSGVMLANLTRWRRSDMNRRIVDAYKTYEKAVTSGDQDILNIVLHSAREWLYPLQCRDNVRYSHCAHGNEPCRSAMRRGANVLHHTAGYLSAKPAVFQAIYGFFERVPYQRGTIATNVTAEAERLRQWLADNPHGDKRLGVSANGDTLCPWLVADLVRKLEYGGLVTDGFRIAQ